jgi:hypothetical protein
VRGDPGLRARKVRRSAYVQRSPLIEAVGKSTSGTIRDHDRLEPPPPPIVKEDYRWYVSIKRSVVDWIQVTLMSPSACNLSSLFSEIDMEEGLFARD